jgi:ribulose-phosphate 3-epimerase
MIKLAPSILAADFSCLGEQIRNIESTGTEYLHIDVMDGQFVPSISFGVPLIASIRKHTKLVFDVHLMIEEPIRYLQDFKNAGADIITVHAEACRHLHRTIDRIKELGLKAGVALNPATPLCELEYVINDLDMVLVMTVNPGFGGQTLISGMLTKIADLKEMTSKSGSSVDIEVDGGITDTNLPQLLQAGANVIVAGTSLLKGDIRNNILHFKQIASEFDK